MICANSWDNPDLVECAMYNHIESCDSYAGRQFKLAKATVRAFGHDIPDNITMEQIKEQFEFDYRDCTCYGVTKKG
jgi:hypothetical protein